MNREEILKEYKIENGIIVSPGKFEGEPLYVPYFWEAGMNGMADEDDGEVFGFTINSDDVKEFPELLDDDFYVGDFISIASSEQGFVYIVD